MNYDYKIYSRSLFFPFSFSLSLVLDILVLPKRNFPLLYLACCSIIVLLTVYYKVKNFTL